MAEIKTLNEFHIFSSSYVRAAVNPSQYVKDEKKEIAFIGRSNVGKSSLINSLCGQRKLAYVSREPGKTRTINYYAIQSRRTVDEEEQRQDWYLVDLPGYGFAKTTQQNRDSWSDFIAEYLEKSKNLVMVGLLVDLRHPGLPIDMKAYEWLRSIAPNLQIIGTKGDKLKRNELVKNKRLLDKYFPAAAPAIAYSSLTGEGKDELMARIEEKICE
ncbi:ribosome biogenesis GTP-binding protein YihA/YsxC [Dialister sp.]|uniref:ribosome biogenesis GTP-binding protein YihA/YsxC n=1 Tax=Dialister sp. TaxID=1955814 RepID=UPI002E81B497|nr:ribosome biogenesis GTP-binding protein YihA/YsxC [Dialister sp.]MEE3453017.1 ribosome biogenesis GTP-binding protein YihA/YsxC [Dialister sp.]